MKKYNIAIGVTGMGWSKFLQVLRKAAAGGNYYLFASARSAEKNTLYGQEYTVEELNENCFD